MPRSAKKIPPKTPDDQLKHHLEQAETHLIEAVELFGHAKKPRRTDIFTKRLVHVQETVTSLHAEELIYQRGPLRPPRRRRKAA